MLIIRKKILKNRDVFKGNRIIKMSLIGGIGVGQLEDEIKHSLIRER
jgi:hypothetical protein